MNPELLISARNLLKLVRLDTDTIGVAMSFGKDSLATLDLCSQVFRHIEAYYLYRIRGLRIIRKWAKFVQDRYGVLVRMYPHFDLTRCYRYSVLQPHWPEARKVCVLKFIDLENYFRKDANVEWVAYGWRRNDSLNRAIIMKTCGGFQPETRRVFPLRAWKRKEVYEYLQKRGIPFPPSLGRKDQGGLDFHAGALETLKAYYPDDYRKVLRDFPFAEMQLREPRTDLGVRGMESVNRIVAACSESSTRVPRHMKWF